jgi:hypothetical protein
VSWVGGEFDGAGIGTKLRTCAPRDAPVEAVLAGAPHNSVGKLKQAADEGEGDVAADEGAGEAVDAVDAVDAVKAGGDAGDEVEDFAEVAEAV